MYVEIKDNKLVGWCKNPYLDYVEVDIDYSTFDSQKYSVLNGVLTDISETDEYKAKIAEEQKAVKLADLTSQIEVIDSKRIRSIAEPEIKDTTTGQTWLDYYTLQVKQLREQIAAL